MAAGARPTIPTLILVGELDDWTPAKDCVRKVAQWGSAGPPIELVTYPGAYHDFNLSDLQPGRKIFDHWLEYNAEAANDANRRIREFLAQTSAGNAPISAPQPVMPAETGSMNRAFADRLVVAMDYRAESCLR
jgi:hypothetical protein